MLNGVGFTGGAGNARRASPRPRPARPAYTKARMRARAVSTPKALGRQHAATQRPDRARPTRESSRFRVRRIDARPGWRVSGGRSSSGPPEIECPNSADRRDAGDAVESAGSRSRATRQVEEADVPGDGGDREIVSLEPQRDRPDRPRRAMPETRIATGRVASGRPAVAGRQDRGRVGARSQRTWPGRTTRTPATPVRTTMPSATIDVDADDSSPSVIQ